jgi:beta-N-acetylhexosaminidase
MGMAGIAAVYSPEDAAVEAVRAGADIVLCARLDLPISCQPEMLAQLRTGLLRGVADGRLSLARIDESVRRIEALKERYRVGPPIGTDLSLVGGPAHQRIVDEVLAAGRP